MRLKEHGLIEVGNEGPDGGVEALQVADLQNEVIGLRAGDQVVCFRKGAGNGFFDQRVDTGVKDRGGDGSVEGGRGTDRGCVEFEYAGLVRGQAFIRSREQSRRCEGRVGQFKGGQIGNSGIDDRGKMDGMAVLLQLAIDADVILAERACTEDGHLSWGGQIGRGYWRCRQGRRFSALLPCPGRRSGNGHTAQEDGRPGHPVSVKKAR